MTVSVCPSDEIQAPIEEAWALISAPECLDRWWDARVRRATPPGPLTAGQHIEARAKGPFPARITFDVTTVDSARHRIQMTVRLPFGIVDHATIMLTPVGPDRCRVQFG